MRGGTSLLIQCEPEKSLEIQLALTKELTKRGFKVVILSGGRPCKDLISILRSKKINLKKIHIVDLLCKSMKLNVEDTETVTHMNGIKSLTEMAIHLNKMAIPQKTVLLIDSLTSMLLYNDESVFTRFVSDILRKIKSREAHLILLLIKTPNYNRILAELKYVCDEEITL